MREGLRSQRIGSTNIRPTKIPTARKGEQTWEEWWSSNFLHAHLIFKNVEYSFIYQHLLIQLQVLAVCYKDTLDIKFKTTKMKNLYLSMKKYIYFFCFH